MYEEYNLNFCHPQQQQRNWNGNCGNVVVPEEACLTSACPLEAARNHSRKVACGGSVRKSGFNNHTVKMLRKTEENLTKATTVCGTQKMRVRERRAAWRWRKGRGEEEEKTRPTVSSGNSSGSSCVAIAGI